MKQFWSWNWSWKNLSNMNYCAEAEKEGVGKLNKLQHFSYTSIFYYF